MHDESNESAITLEIGADVVIAEFDGVRAEVRGPGAAYVKERLAEAAIECIRDYNASKRYERDMAMKQDVALAEIERMQSTRAQQALGVGQARSLNRW